MIAYDSTNCGKMCIRLWNLFMDIKIIYFEINFGMCLKKTLPYAIYNTLPFLIIDKNIIERNNYFYVIHFILLTI